MASSVTSRLKWEREGPGFIAYPDGKEYEDRVARLTRSTARTGAWTWLAKCGLASDNGIADSSQEASNAVNKAWPKLIIADTELQAKAVREAGLLFDIERVTVEADPDVVSIFAIEAADKENLAWIMDQVRHRTRTPGLNKLIDAVSRELYKFRTGAR